MKAKNNATGANLGFEAMLWQAAGALREQTEEARRLDEAIWKNLPPCRSCGAGREGLGYG